MNGGTDFPRSSYPNQGSQHGQEPLRWSNTASTTMPLSSDQQNRLGVEPIATVPGRSAERYVAISCLIPGLTSLQYRNTDLRIAHGEPSFRPASVILRA